MISNLKKKLNKKGFTLAELLIVVAIIAILVAIAIPVFTASKTKAQNAVIAANARACKAQAIADYLLSDTSSSAEKIYYYSVDHVGNITEITITSTAIAEGSYGYVVTIPANTHQGDVVATVKYIKGANGVTFASSASSSPPVS